MSRRPKNAPTINIFNYENYRRYLHDWVEDRKKRVRKFSFRSFSRLVGVESPNFLQWLISGRSNLGKASVLSLCKALDLTKRETEYFENMVFYDQAKKSKDRIHYFKEMLKIRKLMNVRVVSNNEFFYYSEWYNVAIREFLNFYDFKGDYNELSRSLVPKILPYQAKKAVKILLDLDLIKKDALGKYVLTEPFVATGARVKSPFVRKFHQDMLARAMDAIEAVPAEERQISSVTASMSEDCFHTIKERVSTFRKEIMEMVAADKENPERVYNIGFNVFPLTKKLKKN